MRGFRLKLSPETRNWIRQNERERNARKRARIESTRAATKYRGTINFDFTHTNPNEYKKLLAALVETGWIHVETSAFVIEGELPTVLQALELIAKQCQDAGILSALTVHVQGSSDFTGVSHSTAKNGPDALREIRRKPWPQAAAKNE